MTVLSKKRPTRIAVIQMKCDPEPAGNLKRAISLLEDAASKKAQIVCLPELFLSQYFCQSEDHKYFALAEPIPGPTTEILAPIARKHGMVIVASLFEKRAAGLYHNTAAVLDADGALLGKYRKMHIPDDPLYYEKFYFTPGDLGFRSWKTKAAQIGVCICWDQWYPEAARLTAMRGAEILFYPTAIGWHPSEKAAHGKNQLEAWKTIQRSHAIANGCFVAVPNRFGIENPAGGEGIQFWGHSFICNPYGEIIAEAGDDTEAILTADVDLDYVDEHRTHWPFLRDRRIDAFHDLTRRLIDEP